MTRRICVAVGLFLCLIFYYFAFSAPSSFPVKKIVTLEKGMGLATLATKLESQHIVRSALWFRIAVITLGGERGLKAGDYYLPSKEGGMSLAWRMVRAESGLTVVKLTIPEGFTKEQIANLFDERFVVFDKNLFLYQAEEGYMFPDTYFVPINATANTAIELLHNNFDKQTEDLHPSREAVIVASIIEAEVKSPEDKVLVSGIIWKRLKMGMALQVDPAPETYKMTGLPAKPINNPGLVSINAAVNPQTSPYLYFMSGRDGKTYYAKTLDEHLANVKKYL